MRTEDVGVDSVRRSIPNVGPPPFVQKGTKRFDDESVEPNDRIGQSILRPTGVKDIFVTMHETGVKERGQRVCETLPASLQPGGHLGWRRDARSDRAKQ